MTPSLSSSAASVKQLLTALPLSLPPFRRGEVWLVGTGPGNPALLTVEALHALYNADVVLHDALVSDAILRLIPPTTELILTGKRHHRKDSYDQNTINQLIVMQARKGIRVVRLKGGDPFLFARGAEEACALAAAQIPIRIISGITTATAAAASAGIPLTNRTINAAITFASGTRQNTKTEPISKTLSQPPLVLYMASQNSRAIAKQLIEKGYPKDDPVAIISHATRPSQNIIQTDLTNCATGTVPAYQTPALIIIGAIVTTRQSLLPYLQNHQDYAKTQHDKP